MLKNIRLHVEKDEEKQNALEAKLAEHIEKTYSRNLNAFQRQVPSLFPYLKGARSQSISIFCNKWGEYNLVDYGLGRTFYGFHPKEEVKEHLKQFLNHSIYVSLSEESKPDTDEEITEKLVAQGYDKQLLNAVPKLKKLLSYPALPENVECLVVLGCGLGIHIQELVENYNIKHLIIYEAEEQYFAASTLVTDWKKVLDTAKSKGTGLYFQIGKDGRDLLKDIQELESHFSITGFYLYKHYNHVVHDSVQSDLIKHSWNDISDRGLHFVMQEDANHYCPSWTTGIDVKNWHLPKRNQSLFQKNLEALKRYYPNIYAEFKNYEPDNWVAIESAQQEINVIQSDKLVTWYSNSPKIDSIKNLEGYAAQPHKDGLILGYKGKKLAHYIHYQFVKETEQILEELEDEQDALPIEIESIILFGLGVGYQMEQLVAEHEIENLFICEPNRDFFYASLFTINWETVLERLDSTGGRVYLNIGDDGSNLIRDLINQFHNIGPYILANTYFYQSYYNACLNIAIAQLREQLQIMISMGEYFDHAFYGISHTKEMIERGTSILVKRPSECLSLEDKSTPVFIIGNGPSLDNCLESIKEYQDRAIIISCGTALQALYKNGIKPDFHAEIEQNRTTFDWASLINAPNFLKEISLISCNGIHPDTCELYKDVFICFKEGESSTVSALNILGQPNYQTLKNAFPTVSNFVADLVANLGCDNIYFMGIDLGFIDVQQHHSKDSGYYKENGEEVYNYAEENNTSIRVPGNFRTTVSTKHEFKVSKQIIEQVISRKNKGQTFYNCSDGAQILGSNPLRFENLLITCLPEAKSKTIENIKSKCFSSEKNIQFMDEFDNKFDKSVLTKEVDKLLEYSADSLESGSALQELIHNQKKLLHESYVSGKSLLFYYLYGTVNYSNSVLTKIASYKQDKDKLSKWSKVVIEKWINTLRTIKSQLLYDEGIFDVSEFRRSKRENILTLRHIEDKSICLFIANEDNKKVYEYILRSYFPAVKAVFLCAEDINNYEQSIFDYAITDWSEEQLVDKFLALAKINAINIIHDNQKIRPQTHQLVNLSTSKSAVNNLLMDSWFGITALLNDFKCQTLFRKYLVSASDEFNNEIIFSSDENLYAINYPYFIAVHNKAFRAVLTNGTRGKPRLMNNIYKKDLVERIITPDLHQKHVEIHKKQMQEALQKTEINCEN